MPDDPRGTMLKGENELSVRRGEAWYSGGRKCQGGEGLRGEKVCKPIFQPFCFYELTFHFQKSKGCMRKAKLFLKVMFFVINFTFLR